MMFVVFALFVIDVCFVNEWIRCEFAYQRGIHYGAKCGGVVSVDALQHHFCAVFDIFHPLIIFWVVDHL